MTQTTSQIVAHTAETALRRHSSLYNLVITINTLAYGITQIDSQTNIGECGRRVSRESIVTTPLSAEEYIRQVEAKYGPRRKAEFKNESEVILEYFRAVTKRLSDT